MEAVRWGILSVSGHYALRVHGPLSRLPDARIVAIASRDKAKATAAASRFGISKSHASYEALLADPEVEAVYIPLPNHLHAEWTEKALRAGKHVLCEKPLAMDAVEAKKMAVVAREKGLLLMEAFMYRFHPQWIRAKEIVEAGEIGAVKAINVNFSYNNGDPANIRNRIDSGGGALYDIGCYAISVSRWMAGAEPRRGLALVERDPDFGIDRLSSAILDFGTCRSVFTVGTRCYPVQRVEVMGEKGAIAVILPFNAYPDVPLALEVSTSLGTRTVEAGPTDQYAAMFAAFGRALRSGAPAPTPIEDGIANMAVIDALFRSEKSGGWAELAR
ncbi:MAG TPA: Gfo/Idh/MocA family oxidoreductase [Rectinemataceae bacterium]|nr:Gfo/Idh/MocA family oxidoreductase [Rectinemataceae bacterium]